MKTQLILFFIALQTLLPSFAIGEEELNDPFEPMNRGIFWFNDKFDFYIFEPVAEGYDAVVPQVAQRSVSNFFDNLKFPAYLVSDILQLKFQQAAEHTGRFAVNSTAGVLGLFDVANDIGLPRHYEDFGIALGYHEVPAGPYLVLPFLGPSNVRDLFGRVVDGFLDPIYYTGTVVDSNSAELAIIAGSRSLEFVNFRAHMLDAIDSAKETSVDYYTFMQSTYLQVRENYIHDRQPGSVSGDSASEALERELEQQLLLEKTHSLP